jgi:hypothetical protein
MSDQEKQQNEELVDVSGPDDYMGPYIQPDPVATEDAEDNISIWDNLGNEDLQDAMNAYVNIIESLIRANPITTNKNILLQYISDPKVKDKKTGGCLIATCEDDQIKIGYSFRNLKDSYEKYYGLSIAHGRLEYLTDAKYIPSRIPYRYKAILAQFIHRVQRYFGSDKKLPYWAIGFMTDSEVIESTVKYMAKAENLSPYIDKFKNYANSI